MDLEYIGKNIEFVILVCLTFLQEQTTYQPCYLLGTNSKISFLTSC